MSDAPELLPCPFCGQTTFLRVKSVGSYVASMPMRPYQVFCTNLSCEDVAGPVEYGEYSAIAAWNTRADLAAAQVAEAVAKEREIWLSAMNDTLSHDMEVNVRVIAAAIRAGKGEG